MSIELPGLAIIVRSLRCTLCPACGQKKGPNKSVCVGCYRRLTPAMQNALYRRVGEGYEPALQAALECLGAAAPHWPPAPAPPPARPFAEVQAERAAAAEQVVREQAAGAQRPDDRDQQNFVRGLC